MAREIPLSRGMVAIVDDADFDWLNQWKWCVAGEPLCAVRRVSGGGGKCVRMHRELLNAPAHMLVDHRNGDPLDNRRENIRLASRAENNRNVPKRRSGRHPYKGIMAHRSGFQAALRCNGKFVHLGLFRTIEEAARAYDRGATQYFGEFARLNFPGAA